MRRFPSQAAQIGSIAFPTLVTKNDMGGVELSVAYPEQRRREQTRKKQMRKMNPQEKWRTGRKCNASPAWILSMWLFLVDT